MCVKGKIRPVETVSRMGVRGIKRMMEGGQFKYDIFDIFLNFCKCHNVSSSTTATKKQEVVFQIKSSEGL
jgi:hypothetical protein